MAANRVNLTTSLPEGVKEDFKAYCDSHGLKLNRTLERIVLLFLSNPRRFDSDNIISGDEV